MSSPLWKRLQLLVSVATVLAAVALLVAAWGWWRLRGSLPVLDGRVAVAGLGAPVTVTRDALGVPTITGADRADVARALGFLHAQDRFFQMDLLRRSGAGELAELVGEAAVPLDQAHRLHGFRRTAQRSLALLAPDRRALLDAYTAGVNAGLAALRQPPWEYAVLRVDPAPWRTEDSVLVVYAMWFDLQETSGRTELSHQALRDAFGVGAAEFFAPRGSAWDSALDGSQLPLPDLPAFRLRRPEARQDSPLPRERQTPGSNSMAVAGAHTASGAALVENDMHLNLSVPHIWYRAVMQWHDSDGTPRRLVGVTLPGALNLVAGSNGYVAWGFTNSYVDTADVVVVETENVAQAYYRTPHGFAEIEERHETIRVKGGEPVAFTARWTEWGPIFAGPDQGRYYALRWTAHDPEATNLRLLDLENARTTDEAVAIAHTAGMPNQNLVAADRAGHIAWTLTGRIPRRVGYDGRFPVSWAYGDRRWDGWLAPEEIPVIANPAEGILWTGNQRIVGGDAYAKLGDAGYDEGARAGQIRDDLRQLLATGRKAVPADLLAVALDDRAVFLERWRQLLLGVLSDQAVAEKSSRRELRDAVRTWNGHASVDSAAFRIVRLWRENVQHRALQPFFDAAQAHYPDFSGGTFQIEEPLWRLAHDQPANLLNPQFASWPELLLSAVDATTAEIDRAGVAPARFTWGERNRLRMRHPFSRTLPVFLAPLLDMPAQPLPGASEMPRVQTPGFGASERMVVSPGHEEEGLFHMPGGQSGHPLSPYYRAGHDAWVEGRPTPLLPGPAQHTLTLASAK